VNPFGDSADDKMTKWYHAKCAFSALKRAKASTKKIESSDDLQGFEDLDTVRQKKIKALIRGDDVSSSDESGSDASDGGDSKKRKKKASAAQPKKKTKVAESEEDDESCGSAAAASSKSSNVFKGKGFVLTGSFSQSQANMTALVINNGGVVKAGVTKNVDYVVSAQISDSAKFTKAKELGIPVVSEQFLHDSIKNGKLLPNKKYRLDDNAEEEEEEEEEAEEVEEASGSVSSAAASAPLVNGGQFAWQVPDYQ